MCLSAVQDGCQVIQTRPQTFTWGYLIFTSAFAVSQDESWKHTSVWQDINLEGGRFRRRTRWNHASGGVVTVAWIRQVSEVRECLSASSRWQVTYCRAYITTRLGSWKVRGRAAVDVSDSRNVIDCDCVCFTVFHFLGLNPDTVCSTFYFFVQTCSAAVRRTALVCSVSPTLVQMFTAAPSLITLHHYHVNLFLHTFMPPSGRIVL